METIDLNLSGPEFTRIANNFYNSLGLDSDFNRINTDVNLFNYIISHHKETKQKHKIAFCCIAVNAPYWEYIKPLVESAKGGFLPGHQVDFLFWSDIPKSKDFNLEKVAQDITKHHIEQRQARGPVTEEQLQAVTNYVKLALPNALESAKLCDNLTVFPIEPEVWPMPTLMRYHLMLQQEEKLKEYDYVFYCDVDMIFANIVGDEILGELTAVQQPMYATRKEFWPPYEPNPKSTSHIKRPGRIISDQGQPRFMPLYVAGGFQGGKTENWIKAMKEMKKLIDRDMNLINYIPIWNDETVWNKYLFDTLSQEEQDKVVILSPSYTYPDGLIKEYFVPMWGRDYQPKLVTLTKKFSINLVGGQHVAKTAQELASLK